MTKITLERFVTNKHSFTEIILYTTIPFIPLIFIPFFGKQYCEKAVMTTSCLSIVSKFVYSIISLYRQENPSHVFHTTNDEIFANSSEKMIGMRYTAHTFSIASPVVGCMIFKKNNVQIAIASSWIMSLISVFLEMFLMNSLYSWTFSKKNENLQIDIKWEDFLSDECRLFWPNGDEVEILN